MNIDQLRQLYNDWNSRKIEFESHNNFIEIKTPFVDMNHDYIHLFLEKNDKGYSLGDDGYILDELGTLGINIKSSVKRKAFFEKTLSVFGVALNDPKLELYINFHDLSEYPLKQHQLIQCMIRVNDILMTARPRVENLFTEDIEELFLDNGIPYNADFSHLGKSGNIINFDFIIGRTRKSRPKLIKAVNNPSKEAYRSPLLAILDVRELLHDYEYYVISNDTKGISDNFVSSLQNHDTQVLRWTIKDSWINDLKIG